VKKLITLVALASFLSVAGLGCGGDTKPTGSKPTGASTGSTGAKPTGGAGGATGATGATGK
jgi:hypothetical protein